MPPESAQGTPAVPKLRLLRRRQNGLPGQLRQTPLSVCSFASSSLSRDCNRASPLVSDAPAAVVPVLPDGYPSQHAASRQIQRHARHHNQQDRELTATPRRSERRRVVGLSAERVSSSPVVRSFFQEASLSSCATGAVIAGEAGTGASWPAVTDTPPAGCGRPHAERHPPPLPGRSRHHLQSCTQSHRSLLYCTAGRGWRYSTPLAGPVAPACNRTVSGHNAWHRPRWALRRRNTDINHLGKRVTLCGLCAVLTSR